MDAKLTAGKCGFSKIVELSYDEAIARTKAMLKEEGFGVLTEIDVRQTLRDKLNVEFPKYVILGACNPPIAHQSLTAEPEVGLLLPCNVVVREVDGKVEVSVVDAKKMLAVVKNKKLAPMAEQVSEKLRRVLERI